MSKAFKGIMISNWNEEVEEYLAYKFNSVNPRFIVISKSVFINATLAKFDNISFIINAGGECLELSFAKVDAEKMDSVIKEILKWDEFNKYSSRFYVKVDKDTSRSILFDSGVHQSPDGFKKYFQKYQTEIIQIKEK